MENYVTIKCEDLEKVHWETNYGRVSFINHDKNGEKYAHEQFLPANLSIPKSLLQQQKVKMTEGEKVDFDELDRDIYTTLTGTLKYIEEKLENSLLHKRLFHNNDFRLDNKAQIEFARAWEDPSLIEVIPEKKWNVKVPPFERTSRYYYKHGGELGGADSVGNDDENQQFTTDELKEYGLGDDMFEKVEVKE